MFLDGGAGLCMVRLAIIDLATGDQPMTLPDGSATIVFNGEIYNYRELRDELSVHIPFRTTSDTEVILNGYRVWGLDVFTRLNGMYAAAIWDARESSLFLTRDPVGVKPLYYSHSPDRLVFASELKVFMDTGVSGHVHTDAISDYLASGYVFSPHTALQGVQQLLPGELLRIDRECTVRLSRLTYLPSVAPDFSTTDGQWVSRMAEQLEQAVVRQTVSDVPVGLLLSAGKDSMFMLKSLMNAGRFQQLKTFTLFYDEPTFSEHRDVKAVVDELGIENSQVKLTADMVREDLPAVCRTMDNLELLPTAVAISKVSALAGEHTKVVLSGNGGDEVFFGYPTQLATSLLLRLGPIARMAGKLSPLIDLLPGSDEYLTWKEKLSRFVHSAAFRPELAHLRWRSVFSFRETSELLYAAAGQSGIEAVMAPQLRYYEEAASLGYTGMDRFWYVDFKTWLVDCCLTMWDKAGMSASLEIRVPMLDLDFLREYMRVPLVLRTKGIGRKGFYNQIVGKVLPERIMSLPKHGFQMPIAAWLRKELKDDFRTYTANLPASHFSRQYIETLWQEFLGGRRDHSLKLWMLGCLSLWAESNHLRWS